MKRTFSHWTATYIKDRIINILDVLVHPADPWLTRQSINIIKKLIKPENIGLEFGCGRSTIWFGQRCKRLTSLENNNEWFKKIKNQINKKSLNNIDLKLLDDEESYIREIDLVDDCSIDFCLVDGVRRDICALNVIPKLKKNSFLIIDNINWYFPSKSISRLSVRSFDEKTKWKMVFEKLKKYKCIWTSNGVTDTAIFIL